jgi:predicted MPP superfamily phosphohydrolase
MKHRFNKADEMTVDTGRRQFIRNGGLGLIALGSGMSKIETEEDYEIVERDLPVRTLPAAFEGVRAAMIADIHSGPSMSKQRMDRYVEQINRLRPDVVFLPGDFVDHRISEIDPACEALRELRAPLGVFGCLGNHDYYADADIVARELTHAGVRMLRNEHLYLEKDGSRLALIGIDDVGKEHPFDALFGKAVAGLPPSVPNILLCHKPYYLDDAAAWGVGAMLSGHTHGGQIVLARVFDFALTPASIASPYVAGMYTSDATNLYVSRGIGTVGIPVRINCPPEITVFRLTGTAARR